MSTEHPHILAALRAMWPERRSLKSLMQETATALDVHVSSTYRWVRLGMGTASALHVIRLQELYFERTGEVLRCRCLLTPNAKH